MNKPRIDYKEVLDEATFARFSKLREIRKKVAQEEGIPAYDNIGFRVVFSTQ